MIEHKKLDFEIEKNDVTKEVNANAAGLYINTPEGSHAVGGGGPYYSYPQHNFEFVVNKLKETCHALDELREEIERLKEDNNNLRNDAASGMSGVINKMNGWG